MRISGRVVRTVFSKEETAFYILSMAVDNADHIPVDLRGELLTVKGNIPAVKVEVGSWIPMEGKMVSHEKYGDQFKITSAPVLSGEIPTLDEIIGILHSNGVGSVLVTLLKKTFGDNLFSALQSAEELLKVNEGRKRNILNKITASTICSDWKRRYSLFQTLNMVSNLSISSQHTKAIWTKYGLKAVGVLTKSPWKMAVDGVLPFSVCDTIAINFNLPMDSLDRVDAAIIHSCLGDDGSGHLFFLSGDILWKVRRLIPELDTKQFVDRLTILHNSGAIHIDKTTSYGMTAIYSKKSYHHEDWSARKMVERNSLAPKFDHLLSFRSIHPKMEIAILDALLEDPSLKEASLNMENVKIDDFAQTFNLLEKSSKFSILKKIATSAVGLWSETANLKLSDLQKKGVINGLVYPVSVITGLPGTGKTTSLRSLVNIYRQMGIHPTLLAPTGIAAKRLGSLAFSQAYTIHKALGATKFSEGDEGVSNYEGLQSSSDPTGIFDMEDSVWEYSPSNPHPAKVIIVDESSMVDQSLLYRILFSTGVPCRLILVGDAAQLPSVGAGDVLRSIIKSDCFPSVALTEIYRQKDTSDIIYASHDIHSGVVPDHRGLVDFKLLQSSNEHQILASILKAAKKSYANRYNFQIISPRHKGVLGVTNLNVKLREVLNPPSMGLTEVKIGDTFVREGDRVMIIKNDYGKDIFNGDVGKVSSIDRKSQKIVVKIHGSPSSPASLVSFDLGEVFKYLRLAYAMTVHKSQGQEYDYIYMPIVDTFSIQLVRNLLYTGVTRAKKKVLLFGTQTALAKAVNNNTQNKRNTLFSERLVTHSIPF